MYASLTPVRNLGTAASALILAVCATNAYATWTAWDALSVMTDYLHEVSGVTDADLYAVDDNITTASLASLLALAVAGIVFLTWLSHARANADSMNDIDHRLSRGWTIGAWFCPIVNLWFPRRIIDDIWRTSRSGTVASRRHIEDLPLSPQIRLWWFLMVGDYLVQLLAQFETRREIAADRYLSPMLTVAIYSTISTVLSIGAAVLLIRVIRQISEWQSSPRRADEGLSQQRA